jgi:ABC-type transport system involved in multi-copper enzyme maturation permease subunit
MLKFYSIASNTFKEALREPIFFILLSAAIALIGLFPSLALFVFKEQVKFIIDSSMATTLSFGLAVAVLCASSTISREIKNGTVLLMMSKPVSRISFIISKAAGVLAALTVFVFICSLASILSVQVAGDQFKIDFFTLYLYYGVIAIASAVGAFRNFYAKKSFSESSVYAISILLPIFIIAVQIFPLSKKLLPFPYELLPALTLLFFAVWTMGAISVMLSTKLDMIANLAVSCFIFSLGLISDFLFTSGMGSNFFKNIAYTVIPNWQFFWLADAIANKAPISWNYVILCGLYSILYFIFCSVIAVTLFANREVAA